MKLDKGEIIGFIDIATTKIIIAICRCFRNAPSKLLSVSEVETQGFKNGEVVNYSMFVQSLNSALEMAEASAGLNITDVIISLSGLRYKSNFFQSVLNFPFETTLVSKRHVKDSVNAIDFPETFDKEKEYIVHINPVKYIVDDDREVDDPEGMFIKKLSTTYQVISVSRSTIKNLKSILDGLSLNVKKFVVNSYASAVSTLIKDEKDLGSLVIDIGASNLYLALFENNKFMFNASIPLGGNILNYHLMHHLNITFPEAERLKKQYGSIHPEGIDFSKDISFSIIDDNGSQIRSNMKKSDLLSLSNGALLSIVKKIRSQFPANALSHIQKIILTGGGAKTIGISDLFADVFNCTVRVANPLTSDVFGDRFNKPEYSTLVGLFLDYKDSLEHPVLNAKSVEKQNLLKKLKFWYNKYFG